MEKFGNRPDKRSDSRSKEAQFTALLNRHLFELGTRPDGGALVWTVKEFADALGSINERTVQNWLQGRNLPTESNLTSIGRALFGTNERYERERQALRNSYRLARNSEPKSSQPDAAEANTEPVDWDHYDGLLQVGEFRVPFAPLLNPDGRLRRSFSMAQVKIFPCDDEYDLPASCESLPIEKPFEESWRCRLLDYMTDTSENLNLWLSRIRYSQYLRSNEYLDYPMPDNPGRTFRDAFASSLPRGRDHSGHSVREFPLTNILGMGLFLVSSGKEVLVRRRPANGHIYPSRWSFSASGPVQWGAWPHPFIEIIWKARNEIGHQVNPGNVELIEFGVDARKIYFECCFVEWSDLPKSQLEQHLNLACDHEWLPLSALSSLLSRLIEKGRCWEPAAEAMLLMLAIKLHGLEAVLARLREQESNWRRHRMLDEWDHRASRLGDSAVLSARYERNGIDRTSEEFANRQLQFIDVDIDGKRVLEVGSGIGRLTRRLVQAAKAVTCVEISARMNQRNKEQLDRLGLTATFAEDAIQDFRSGTKFDVAICSLVLIHNVEDRDFRAAVSKICSCSGAVFVFEDITEGRRASLHTNIRSAEALVDAFKEHGFVLQRRDKHLLCKDTIAFLQFVREHA